MEKELDDKWNDGLRAALSILDSNKNFEVSFHNLSDDKTIPYKNADFVLGWGGFNSPVDIELEQSRKKLGIKTGLCVGGNAFPARKDKTYDVLFYETNWYQPQLEWHPNIHRAFGINSEIFFEYFSDDNSQYPLRVDFPLYDYVSAGSFSHWKRHDLMLNKTGNRLCIGQIQQNNLPESMSIILDLIKGGVAISDQVDPYQLALIFNLTENVYVPASIIGGGERVTWEARACGCYVEIEDNPKLKSLLDEDVLDEYDYYRALRKGIESCLTK